MSGRSSTVFGYRGVTVDTARIRTGSATPCRRANSMLDSTSAAPPSRGGADVEQPQRIGDHGGGGDLLGA